MEKHKRKTRDYWEVQIFAESQYGWETVCAANTRREAVDNKRDYEKNTSYPIRIVKKREKIEQEG